MGRKDSRMSSDVTNVKYFYCPNCRLPLIFGSNYFLCEKCKTQYPIKGGVPDFRGGDHYWCNVSPEKMNMLIKRSVETGDWHKSAEELIPQYLSHIDRYDRADLQFMLPISSDSSVLDAGSMWGGLSVPLAQYCKEVVSLDKTLETLQYLNVRCVQDKISNIRVVASQLKRLPFRDNYFDCVILNGVLEWVGFDDELVLEKHWGMRRNNVKRYKNNPRKYQLDVLKEINRVLKPGGFIFLAIENRFGYPYFIGQPDDHMNIRFLPFLPRFIANAITMARLNSEYRTYIYGVGGLTKLLKEGNFKQNSFYGVFPHYIMPQIALPLSFVGRRFAGILNPIQWYKKTLLKVIPNRFYKYFVPSFMVISSKGRHKKESMIVNVLRKTGLINAESQDVKIIKSGGRPGNYLTSNFVVYQGRKNVPRIFCKVCRSKEHTEVLQDESSNLKEIEKLLKNTIIDKSFPELMFFGTVNKVTILCTKYKTGKAEKIDHKSYLPIDRLIKKISPIVDKSIDYLVAFQNYTKSSRVEKIESLASVCEREMRSVEVRGMLDKELKECFRKYKDELANIKDTSIPISAVHGDYDLCNIQIIDGKCNIFDFEHFQKEGKPFFDLSNLLFPIFLANESMQKGSSGCTGNSLHNIEVKNFIREKLVRYAKLTNISNKLLRLLGPISAIEHKAYPYPYYREPRTYLLYRDEVMKALMNLRVDL